MYVRFNTVNSGVKDLRVLLMDNGQKKFSEHPNPYVDIVAIYINKAILEKHNSKSDAIILDSHSLNLAAMKASSISCVLYIRSTVSIRSPWYRSARKAWKGRPKSRR